MMDLEDENIDSFIDMETLLNDPELNNELDLLLQNESKPVTRQPKRVINNMTNNTKSDEKYKEEVQMDTVGLVDDTTLVLTAEDLEDPELLAQFNDLNSTNDLLGTNTSNDVVKTPSNAFPNHVAVSTLYDTDTQTGSNKLSKEHRSNDSQMSAEEAKRMALKFKREGNTDEALKWIRYAKKLESGNALSAKEAISPINKATPTSNSYIKGNSNQNQSLSIESLKTIDRKAPPSSKSSTSSSSSDAIVSKVAASVGIPQPVPAIPSDRFAALEIALVEASRISLFEAKKLEKVDPQTAVARMREYKGYQQELTVLKSTRSTNGEPAAFRWEVVRKETVVENKELGEDQVEVSILSGHNLDVVLAAEKCTTISVSYNLGIISSSSGGSDSTDTGSTSKVRYADGRADFNFKSIFKGLKRGRTVQQSYNRKKAVFQLVAHKGMIFTSTSTIGVCVVPLNDLLTKCCIEVESPLMAAAAVSVVEDGSGSKPAVPSMKKSKTIGGTIRIIIKVRSPLLGPQKVVSEEKRLVVGPWPLATVIDTPLPVPPAPHIHNHANQLAQQAVAAPAETPSQLSSTAQFDTLTELEKSDPFSVDLLESNDVLENEIESTANAITVLMQQQQQQKNKSLFDDEEDQLMSLQCRMPILQSKLGILVFKVQSEALSFAEYIDMIKARLRRDQILAVYLRSLQAKESNEAALKVFRRVKIMTEELRNAEASS